MSVITSIPVVERIAVKLFERLQVLASGNNPDLAVREVIRPTRNGGFTPQHLQIVFTQADPEIDDGEMRPGNPPAVTYRQRFNIICHLFTSEKDPTPIDKYQNLFYSNVIRAVTKNRDSWYSFNGLAVDSEFLPLEHIGGELDTFILPIVITYRVSEWNPCEVRT